MAQTDQIDALLANPKIPTLPSAALRVLEKVGSPDCTLDAVGEIVRQDPALCGLIVKTLNSALYSFSRPVTSVDKALVMLGLTRIRSLILTLYLPAIKSATPLAPVLSDFWQGSVIGAIIARELAVRCNRRDPETDLLAALMRDLGQLVMHQGLGSRYEQALEAAPGRSHADAWEAEKAAFGFTHAEVSGELLRRWRLPESLWRAVACHHAPGAVSEPDTSTRAAILHFAALASDFLTHPHAPGLRAQLLASARDGFGMDKDALASFLSPLNEKALSVAAFLNVDLGVNENFATVLSNANEELVRLAMESSMETLRQQAAAKRAEAEAATWRERATRDSLTGLVNRPHLITLLDSALKRARRTHTAVGLLFLDLDGFKPINDRFGHASGDVALKEVGAHLRANIRTDDVVARFGGDEFCVMLPETTEDGTRKVGERIVKAIAELPLKFNGQDCRIGASVGAAVALPWVTPVPSDELVAAADKAMYAAKHRGKNQLAVESLYGARERRALDAVRARMFRTFLAHRECLTQKQLDDAVARRAPRPSLQRVARKLGWLSREDAIRVAHAQRFDGLLFEDAIREMGCLEMEQYYVLLACRQEVPELLARRLVRIGLLTEVAARRELKAYYEWLATSVAVAATPVAV
jgi:diguanylate cyclase (GGDEF)-like protein